MGRCTWLPSGTGLFSAGRDDPLNVKYADMRILIPWSSR